MHPSSGLVVTAIIAAVVGLGFAWARGRDLPPWLPAFAVAGVAGLNGLLYRTNAEDAFITYRYAVNLAAGRGPVFNEGERVEGYSNFLWMIILAAANRISGIRIELVARGLGVVIFMAAAVATYRLALLVTSGRRTIAGACALVVACAGPLGAYSASGLETPLFVLLTVLMTNLLLHDRPAGAGLVAGLATMTRPDGLVFVGVAALWLITLPRTRSDRWPQVTRFAATFGALFLPWTVWRIVYYGHLVPNALVAKSGGVGVGEHLRAGLDYLGASLLDAWPLLILGSTVLVAVGLGRGRLRPSRSEWLLVIAVASFCGFLAVTGGDWMPAHRLFAPVIPLFAVLCGSVWVRATTGIGDRSAEPVFGLVTCGAALLLVGISFWSAQQLPLIRLWADQVAALSAQGEWFATTLPEGSTIATYANGALSYHAGTDRIIIDMLGLTDEHIARSGRRLTGSAAPVGHRAYDYDDVARRRPDVVIFSGSGFRTTPDCSVPTPFARRYRAVSFRFPTENPTGRYVTVLVRADAAPSTIGLLGTKPGVVRSC